MVMMIAIVTHEAAAPVLTNETQSCVCGISIQSHATVLSDSQMGIMKRKQF